MYPGRDSSVKDQPMALRQVVAEGRLAEPLTAYSVAVFECCTPSTDVSGAALLTALPT